MEITFEVVGDQELDRLLEEVQYALRSDILEQALQRAAKPTVELAVALAPRGDPPSKRPLHTTIKAVRGLSRRELRRRRSMYAREIGLRSGRNLTRAEGAAIKAQGEGYVTITATAPHAHLVERGHVAVKVKRGFFLTTTTVIGHVPAYPFLRPAWDQTRSGFAERFRTELSRGIQAAIKRAARAPRAA